MIVINFPLPVVRPAVQKFAVRMRRALVLSYRYSIPNSRTLHPEPCANTPCGRRIQYLWKCPRAIIFYSSDKGQFHVMLIRFIVDQ